MVPKSATERPFQRDRAHNPLPQFPGYCPWRPGVTPYSSRTRVSGLARAGRRTSGSPDPRSSSGLRVDGGFLTGVRWVDFPPVSRAPCLPSSRLALRRLRRRSTRRHTFGPTLLPGTSGPFPLQSHYAAGPPSTTGRRSETAVDHEHPDGVATPAGVGRATSSDRSSDAQVLADPPHSIALGLLSSPIDHQASCPGAKVR